MCDVHRQFFFALSDIKKIYIFTATFWTFVCTI